MQQPLLARPRSRVIECPGMGTDGFSWDRNEIGAPVGH